MADGRVRVTFPTGWKVSKKLIRVTDGDTVYETDDMGDLVPSLLFVNDSALDDEERKAKANATVTFEADRHITVNLGSEWSSTNNSDGSRQLIIILADVTVPIPSRLTEDNGTANDYSDDYANIRFTCSSSAKNGTLIRLSDAVEVKVGNILGNRDLADADNDGQPDGAKTRDPLIREVKVTPARVFIGDTNISVQIVFEAPGPMYGTTLVLTIPTALQAGATSDITVSGRGGTVLANPSNVDLTNIVINKIDEGQRVVVSYRIATVDGNDGKITATTGGTNARVTGGVASALAGSGRMSISPPFVNAGVMRRDITLTYTAYTKLEGYDIEIRPRGIVLDSTNTLQKTNTSGYGHVSGNRSSSDLTIDSTTNVITWSNVTIDPNTSSLRTLRTIIRRVNISANADNYSWTVLVGPTGGTLVEIEDDLTTDVDERAILSVVKTSGGAVDFAIEGDNFFHAGSRETITFRFTADETPIRNGRISLTIPSALGSPPTTAKDRPGRVTVEIDDDDGTLEPNQPTISGRTINVAIKELVRTGTVTIKYGTDEDNKESEKAVLHHVAGAVRVSGTFRVSSSAGTSSAGSETITLNNVKDGTGSATLSPTSIAAGSNNQAIEVVYTAAGTMNGGR